MIINKKYFSIFYLGIKNTLIFRANTLISLLTQVVNLCVSMWIWKILLPSSADFVEMTKYLLLTNVTAIIFTTYPLYFFADLVSSGKLSMYVTKPMSMYWYIYLYNLGRQSLFLIFYFGLIMIFSKDILVVSALFIYMFIANFMFFNFMLLLGELSFWIINMWPLRNGINAVYLLLGGLYFPLNMLNKSIYVWIRFNPFSLVTDVPANLIISGISSKLIVYIIAAVIWLILFRILQKYLFEKGFKKYEGVGI